jgi:hypothetical protein
MYRALALGGRYITFSLHPISEVLQHFDKKIYDWSISVYNVRSLIFCLVFVLCLYHGYTVSVGEVVEMGSVCGE